MEIRDLDIVELKNGKKALVLDIYGNGTVAEAEFDFSAESDIRTIDIADVKRVIGRNARYTDSPT